MLKVTILRLPYPCLMLGRKLMCVRKSPNFCYSQLIVLTLHLFFYNVIVSMEISYMTQNIDMPQLNTAVLEEWIEKVASMLGKRVGALTYVFCDDEYILDTNRQFLGHDYYTDIITFDYSNSHRIAGDMVISIDTVKSNAQQLGVDYDSELLRVIIHGVLHLCGINDKGPGEREIMEQHENEALAVLPQGILAK